MGTFTGRGPLNRVFGLAGIRSYFGPWNTQSNWNPATKTWDHKTTLDVVLDNYVPEDRIFKRLEKNLKPYNFYWATVPAGALWGATAGPAGAVLGAMFGAGIGYALNLLNHTRFEMQESHLVSGATIYEIKSPTVSGLVRSVAAQEKELLLAIGRELKSEIISRNAPHPKPSWRTAFRDTAGTYKDLILGAGRMLKDIMEEQTGPSPELPDLYVRKVDVAKTADPLRYELVYDARAPEGQIVRDTNRIIKTFTGAEFWPRVKENLSKKWDWLTYKLATATA